MADAFANIRLQATEAAATGSAYDHSQLLRELDNRQKQILSLFAQSRFVTTKEIAGLLGIQPRSALNVCKKWAEQGFIVQHGTAPKTRKYELAEKWLSLIAS